MYRRLSGVGVLVIRAIQAQSAVSFAGREMSPLSTFYLTFFGFLTPALARMAWTLAYARMQWTRLAASSAFCQSEWWDGKRLQSSRKEPLGFKGSRTEISHVRRAAPDFLIESVRLSPKHAGYIFVPVSHTYLGSWQANSITTCSQRLPPCGSFLLQWPLLNSPESGSAHL